MNDFLLYLVSYVSSICALVIPLSIHREFSANSLAFCGSIALMLRNNIF